MQHFFLSDGIICLFCNQFAAGQGGSFYFLLERATVEGSVEGGGLERMDGVVLDKISCQFLFDKPKAVST